jgi:G3E family GTPase
VSLNFIIVSGVLGVDRHGVIKGLVHALHAGRGSRVAVIASEHGPPCMDSPFISEHEVLARDLRGGCVACSLKTDLIDCIRGILRDGQPDVIIFEPAGTADPGIVRDALEDCSGVAIDKVVSILVLDATLFYQTWRMFQRPLRNHVLQADLALAFGLDAVSGAEREDIVEKLAGMGFQGQLCSVEEGCPDLSHLLSDLL